MNRALALALAVTLTAGCANSTPTEVQGRTEPSAASTTPDDSTRPTQSSEATARTETPTANPTGPTATGDEPNLPRDLLDITTVDRNDPEAVALAYIDLLGTSDPAIDDSRIDAGRRAAALQSERLYALLGGLEDTPDWGASGPDDSWLSLVNADGWVSVETTIKDPIEYATDGGTEYGLVTVEAVYTQHNVDTPPRAQDHVVTVVEENDGWSIDQTSIAD